MQIADWADVGGGMYPSMVMPQVDIPMDTMGGGFDSTAFSPDPYGGYGQADSPPPDPYGGYGQADAPPWGGALYSFTGGTPGGAPSPWAQFFKNPSTLLGLGGGLAGLIGTLAGGGNLQSTIPRMSVPQRALAGQAAGALGSLDPFIQGTSPLQTMQTSLLQALASGQGLPPGYQKLVEQAFQPQLGDLYTQAARQGQARGFYDAPATSPPGGAILGPGLAALQGQQAAAKLGLMQSLPGLFNQPIQTRANAAGAQVGGYNNLFASYPRGQTTTAPLGPQIGQGIGQTLTGLGQAFQGEEQNQRMMDLWNRILAGGDLQGLSGTRQT